MKVKIIYVKNVPDIGLIIQLIKLLKDFMISISDEYNTGLHGGTDTHYFNFLGVWTYKSSRLQLGYGRTSEGLNCTGGVCRKVPAQRGFTASWYYVF